MRNVLIDLYVATFGRAPDPDGLNYWLGQYEILSLPGVASNMMMSPEAQGRFPGGLDNADLISVIYNNLFDREPDAEGLNYWVEQMETGAMSREMAIAYIVDGARAPTGDPNDAVILNERVSAAREYLEQVEAGLRGFSMNEANAVIGNITRDIIADPAPTEPDPVATSPAPDPGDFPFSIISETPTLDSSGYDSFYWNINDVLGLPGARIVLLETGSTEIAYIHPQGDGLSTPLQQDHDTFMVGLDAGSVYRMVITPEKTSTMLSAGGPMATLYDTSGDFQTALMTLPSLVDGSYYSSFFEAHESGYHFISISQYASPDITMWGVIPAGPKPYEVVILERGFTYMSYHEHAENAQAGLEILGVSGFVDVPGIDSA